MQRRKLSLYRPHPKQADHLRAGSTKLERALFAANRSGKSLTCAAEGAAHATGQYPDWWEGKRFSTTTLGWACGTSNEVTRDVVQSLLLGDSEMNWGTGMIPAANIIKVDKSRGLTGAADKIFVRHISGGVSIVQFKSYEQTWKKFTSAECHWIWLDEEPDDKIYSECLARITNTKGIVFLSLTPLQGKTEVVNMFHPHPSTADRHLTMMTIDDALHMDDEMREKAIAKYQPYERDARLKGIPMLGSGRVFPISESVIQVEPFEVPTHWPKMIGMDFGWDHPTAAVLMAYDREVDCLYVTHEYRVSEEMPVVHAAAIKAWGDWPVFWPHDGNRATGLGCKSHAAEFRKEGLRMHWEHATFDDGGNMTEPGVHQMLDRMRTNRWKVFDSCPMWIEEFRAYHRKDGALVDDREDLICASRYAMMMRRFARVARPTAKPQLARDWDPLDIGARA
jgi:phage terminase large subunit-like protein